MANQPLPDTIADLKQKTVEAKEDLLRTFSFVPDEKLTYAPSESARWAIWIVGHTGLANRAFATAIRGDEMHMPSDPAEFGKMIHDAGKDLTSREEAVKLIEESTNEFVAALDGLTEQRLNEAYPTPFGPMPIPMWINLGHIHMTAHARQIDYLQTIWGDLVDHM